MKEMEMIGWIALVYMLTRNGSATVAEELEGDAWIWPMLTLPDGRKPVITDGFGSDRDGGSRKHKGVDIMYRRKKRYKGPLKYPLPDHGSKAFEVPPGTHVVASHAGKVYQTGKTPLGHFVILDHGPEPYATFYQHLEVLAIPPHRKYKLKDGGAGLRVGAGTILGTVGHSLADGQQIRHLHFELRKTGVGAIDPAPIMKGWRVL